MNPLFPPRSWLSTTGLFSSLWLVGFRPFFLLAALYATWILLVWLGVLLAGMTDLLAWDSPTLWHAHEMLFGYTAAVIGGFLLTAVPNWTKARPIRAWPLVLLVAIWLMGRLAMHSGGALPWWLVAALDLAFLPAIALSLLPAIIRGSSNRNYIFFVILGLLTLLNGVMHTSINGLALWLDASQAAHAGLLLVVLMIVIFGGRVVPMFTRNALRVAGMDVDMSAAPWLAWLASGTVACLTVLALCGLAESLPAAYIALAAGGLNLALLSHWHGHRTCGMPIVWVLHAGYGWLALGLLGYGVALLTEPSHLLLAFHILGIGGIGTMTLAMMSRVSLGHTGHKLQAAQAVVGAYWLMQLAVVVRLAGGFGWMDYLTSLAVAGTCWSLAFFIFAVVYLPILWRPRADGLPA